MTFLASLTSMFNIIVKNRKNYINKSRPDAKASERDRK